MGNLTEQVEVRFNGQDGIVTQAQNNVTKQEALIYSLRDQKKAAIERDVILTGDQIGWDIHPVPGSLNLTRSIPINVGTGDYDSFGVMRDGADRFHLWLLRKGMETGIAEMKKQNGTIMTGAPPLIGAPDVMLSNVRAYIDLPKPGPMTYLDVKNVRQACETYEGLWAAVNNDMQSAKLWSGYAWDKQVLWDNIGNICQNAINKQNELINNLNTQISEAEKLLADLRALRDRYYVDYTIELKLARMEEENIAGYRTYFDAIKLAYESGDYATAQQLIDSYNQNELQLIVTANEQKLAEEKLAQEAEAQRLAQEALLEQQRLDAELQAKQVETQGIIDTQLAQAQIELDKQMATKRLIGGIVMVGIAGLVAFFIFRKS